VTPKDATINIRATSRNDLEEQLEKAVAELRAAAMATRSHGILVTRHQPGTYSAALSDRVPFGLTQELIH
jgi:hypothetical protein